MPPCVPALTQGAGLGRHEQGRPRPVEVEVHSARVALDYLDEDRARRAARRPSSGRRHQRPPAPAKAAAASSAGKPKAQTARAVAHSVFDFLNRRVGHAPADPSGDATATSIGPVASSFTTDTNLSLAAQLLQVQTEQERVRREVHRCQRAARNNLKVAPEVQARLTMERQHLHYLSARLRNRMQQKQTLADLKKFS